MTDRKKIGDLLRRHRQKAKLTYRQLGEQAGIPWATLHSLEIGRGKLTAEQLASLSSVLGKGLLKKVVAANRPPKRPVAR